MLSRLFTKAPPRARTGGTTGPALGMLLEQLIGNHVITDVADGAIPHSLDSQAPPPR